MGSIKVGVGLSIDYAKAQNFEFPLLREKFLNQVAQDSVALICGPSSNKQK